jgi:hypothetical protein
LTLARTARAPEFSVDLNINELYVWRTRRWQRYGDAPVGCPATGGFDYRADLTRDVLRHHIVAGQKTCGLWLKAQRSKLDRNPDDRRYVAAEVSRRRRRPIPEHEVGHAVDERSFPLAGVDFSLVVFQGMTGRIPLRA